MTELASAAGPRDDRALREHDRLREGEQADARSKATAPDADRDRLELAGSIGNVGMQRVAGARQLQRAEGDDELLGAQASTGGAEIFLGETGGLDMAPHEATHAPQQGLETPPAPAIGAAHTSAGELDEDELAKRSASR